MHGVTELQQSLKLIVPGESDDLQHRAELTEDLQTRSIVDGEIKDERPSRSEERETHLLQDLQRHRVEQVLHDDPQDGALAVNNATAVTARCHGPRMHCCRADGLQRCSLSLTNKSF